MNEVNGTDGKIGEENVEESCSEVRKREEKRVHSGTGSDSGAARGNVVYLRDRSGEKLKRNNYNGVVYPDFPNLHENWPNLHKLRVRPDDVTILAYESSGTHWVWEVVHMLLRGRADYIDGIKEEQFLEMASLDMLEKSASPRVMNTHHLPSVVTPELVQSGRKVIFITRNPKDVYVSQHKHCVSSSITMYRGGFSDYFDLHLSEQKDFLMNTWTDYIKDWETYFNSQPGLNVLYLYYEDMKENLAREVKSVADYLSLEVDDRLIRDITDRCTFDNMKVAKIASHPDEKDIYRTGKAWTWKDHFTVAMSERYDRLYHDQMAGSSIAARVRFSV